MACLWPRTLQLIFFAYIFISSARAHKQPSDKRVPLFIFGDSFYDVGNNNYINTTIFYQSNFWPYGMTFFRYPTGRRAEGRLVVDFIAEYAKLPFIKPYLEPGFTDYSKGANFASGAAGALVETSPGLVIDLDTQLKYFKNVQKNLIEKLGKAKSKRLFSSSVYLFSVGANDYFYPVLINSTVYQSYSKEEYVGMVVGNITAVIKEIYMSGGRKFGFLSLGNIGCGPPIRALLQADICMEELNHLAELHDKSFSASLHKLKSHLKEFKYSYFDCLSWYTERMNNPAKYGFVSGKMACCGSGPFRGYPSCGGIRGIKEYELCDNPGEYVFFDDFHLTERANQQFAESLWSGSPDTTGPYNVEALFKL